MRSILITLFVFSSTLFFVNKANACSPYGTPLVTHTIVGNKLNITVTSKTAWSCSFEFELELIFAAANFSGNAQFSRPQTPNINKPNTANMNYQVFTIDISNLCPGTTYKYRVREKHLGLIFSNRIIRPLRLGETTTGFVEVLREDGKIDISLAKIGVEKFDDFTNTVMDYLKENNNRMFLTDKSDPDEIRAMLGMSKKSFKKAVGNLYKLKRVALHSDYIELLD